MALKCSVLILFALFSVANIIAVGKRNKLLEQITKPFLMPLLLVFYLLCVKAPNILIVLALTGGFWGDTLLLGSGIFFTFGLIAFLTGHAFYITAFLKPLDFATIPAVFYLLAVPYIVYSVQFCKRLFPAINKEKPQVVIYMVCLLAMSFSSLLRVNSVGGPQFWLPFVGSLLFIASDSMLAFDSFKEVVKGRIVAIMVTYLLAQSLIIAGFII
jgi:uncharacterized membrane protein YhhN